jgi:hypothetical protein
MGREACSAFHSLSDLYMAYMFQKDACMRTKFRIHKSNTSVVKISPNSTSTGLCVEPLPIGEVKGGGYPK